MEILLVNMLRAVEKRINDRTVGVLSYMLIFFVLASSSIMPAAGMLIPIFVVPLSYMMRVLILLEINKSSGNEERATLMSAAESIVDLLVTILNPIMGYIALDLPLAFVVMAVISIVAAVSSAFQL